ncbi:MAG: putative DNA binding domain-containing protein [Bacteroidetes bacterium]|nr:putative DNA binding domain-containing protein [Bacteroidota bacterium]
MMNAEQIKSIIALGEGYQAEFKVSVPSKVREITEEVCAFANSAGGVILIGIDDHNQICGVSIDNARRSAIQNSVGEISPGLNCTMTFVEVDSKQIAVLEVNSGRNKPYVFSGAIYVRQGPNTQKLTTAEEMRDFFQQAGKLYFDEIPCEGFKGESEIDNSNLSFFRNEAGLPAFISNEQLFLNLRLFDEGKVMKSGAVLFFAAKPEDFYPQAIIRCVAFKGTDKRFIIDDKEFGGPLYQQYLSAMSWLHNKINVSYDIENQGGKPRKENWEIPETVFKEAIINSLSHRDYYEKGAVTTIEVFDNRIEISNPGGLLSAIRHDFGKRSMSRNPLIFGLFARMHLVEKIGSGVPRMKELMLDSGLTAPEYHLEGMFTIILRKAFDFERWVERWADHLTENRILIVKIIHENPAVSKLDMQKALDLSSTAIDNNLNYLKNAGLVEHIGPDRGGEWRINYINPGG